MKADIITIGDEILIGQIVDTNSAWMAQRLGEIGLSVRRKYSIGDRREEIVAAVEESLAASEVVLITGGLGPTKDDITKKVLAEIFHSTLVRHEETYARVERMMTARGIEFNALNQGQALVPECCTVLPNHKGTAPGM
ncbi:MAG: competence/damage-inducible protein A, partial [Tidjanibacter sp.]|nr:competence/damage-inducible protein A [Tidjanibacter sp.]